MILIECRRYRTRDLCVIWSGPIQTIDVDGASHRGEPVIPLDKTLPSNLLTSTASISFHVPTNLLWKDTSGSTTGKLSPFSLRPTIVTDAETKPRSWRSMIPSTRQRRTPSTNIANFHNSIRHPETKTGTRVPEHPITFCKSKIMYNYTSVY